MKPALKLFATLSLALAFEACGEKPSFVESEEALPRKTGSVSDYPSMDGTNANPNGPKGVLGQGRPTDPNAPTAGASSISIEPKTDSDDETTGDRNDEDGPSVGNGGGNGNSGKGGAADGVDGGDGGMTGADGHSGTDGGRDGDDDDSTTGGSDGAVTIPDETPDPDGDDAARPRPKTTKASEMSFPADITASAELAKVLDGAYLTSDLEMKRRYYDRVITKKQVVRPVLTDNFEQGYAGADVNELFDQVVDRPLDVLVVIDNSGSMIEEQANLATKLAPLLSEVNSADWVIGVVTTDPNDTCLRKLIKKGDANAAADFAAAVSPGTGGANNERGVLTAVRSLRGDCLSAPWIRRDSTLALLVVTDEDNCSDGLGCPNKEYNKGKYLLDYLATIRQVGKNARLYSLLWHPSQTQAQCPTGYNKGVQWADLVEKTTGKWGSICDADYTSTLTQISRDIAVTLNSKFTMKETPDAGSLVVKLNGAVITTGFTLMGKVLDFTVPPAEGSVVSVSYTHGATPKHSTYSLRGKPLAGALFVTVDGALVQPSSYSVDVAATPSTINFFSAPADRAKIQVTYTKDVALKTQFELGEPVAAGTLKVLVEGVETTAYAVLETNGIVTFAKAPADGATLTFTYTGVGADVLSYPFNPGSGAPVDLVVKDETNQIVPYTYADGSLNFSATQFVEGRKLHLTYDNTARQRFTIDLPNAPTPGRVSATGGTVVCDGAPGLVVEDKAVKVDGCGFADDVMSVSVRYDYVVEQYLAFTYAGADIPARNAWQEWIVTVDGVETKAYVRNGGVIRFPTALPLGSVVKIQLIQEDK